MLKKYYGLTQKKHFKNQLKYGKNIISFESHIYLRKIIANQIFNPITLLLMVVSIFSGVKYYLNPATLELFEFISVTAIVLFNILLGFYLEYRAKKTVQSLQVLNNTRANVCM